MEFTSPLYGAKWVPSNEHVLDALYKGEPVKVRFADKGDLLPAFDEHGNCYEAYTIWWCIKDGDYCRCRWFGRSLPCERCGKPPRPEGYNQIDKWEVDDADNPTLYRLQKDIAAMMAAGLSDFSVDGKPLSAPLSENTVAAATRDVARGL